MGKQIRGSDGWQGLKPRSLKRFFGMTEVMPFHKALAIFGMHSVMPLRKALANFGMHSVMPFHKASSWSGGHPDNPFENTTSNSVVLYCNLR